jgi:hypothetical protein
MAGRRFDVILPFIVLGLACLYADQTQAVWRRRLIALGSLCAVVTTAYLFAWSKLIVRATQAMWPWQAIRADELFVARHPSRLFFQHSPLYYFLEACAHPSSVSAITGFASFG